MPVPISSIVQPDYSRMAELNMLIQTEERLARESRDERGRPRCQYPGKIRNWLKFCRKCGVDISRYSAYVRLCKKCNADLARFGAGGGAQ
jgi:hypothetical protein